MRFLMILPGVLQFMLILKFDPHSSSPLLVDSPNSLVLIYMKDPKTSPRAYRNLSTHTRTSWSTMRVGAGVSRESYCGT